MCSSYLNGTIINITLPSSLSTENLHLTGTLQVDGTSTLTGTTTAPSIITSSINDPANGGINLLGSTLTEGTFSMLPVLFTDKGFISTAHGFGVINATNPDPIPRFVVLGTSDQDLCGLVYDITSNTLILQKSIAGITTNLLTIDRVSNASTFAGSISNGNLTLSANAISSSGATVQISDDLLTTGSISNGNLTLASNAISSSGAIVQINDQLNVSGAIVSADQVQGTVLSNGNLVLQNADISSTGSTVNILDGLHVFGSVEVDNALTTSGIISNNNITLSGSTISSTGSTITINDNLDVVGTISNGDLILSTNTIASTLGSTVFIADNLQVNGTCKAGNITINTDTISSSGSDIILDDRLTINSTQLLGSGLTLATNLGEGVIQVKNVSDATYGNPGSSSLLYSNSSGQLTTKNSSGVKTMLALPSYMTGQHINNVSNTVITTANTVTKITHTLSIVTSGEFAYNTTTKIITYTGPTRLMSINAGISAFNTTVLQTGILQLCITLNATFNGNNEQTAGGIVFGPRFSTNDTLNNNGSLNTMFSVASGDTLCLCIINLANANDVQVIDANLTIESLQVGSG